jgi:hypothetical protein
LKFKHKKTRDSIKLSLRYLKVTLISSPCGRAKRVQATLRASEASASPKEHPRQEPDAHGNIRMMGKQCVQEHGSRTQGKFLVKVLSSGLRRDASSASSLMFYA